MAYAGLGYARDNCNNNRNEATCTFIAVVAALSVASGIMLWLTFSDSSKSHSKLGYAIVGVIVAVLSSICCLICCMALTKKCSDLRKNRYRYFQSTDNMIEMKIDNGEINEESPLNGGNSISIV